MRRASLVLWLTAAMLVLVPAVAQAASIYDPSDCIHNAPVDWVTAPSQPKDQFLVHAPAADAKLAADAANEIRAQNFFGYYESHLSIPALGYPGQTGRYDIYLDPELPSALSGADGVNASSCEVGTRNAVDVYTGIKSSDAFHATLAHELFHAAQAQLGGNFLNNWFYEATATWAETRFGYSDPSGYSKTVTDNPMLPMDWFKPPIDGAQEHEYGAWTFVAWLFSRGKINWTTMRQIFQGAAQSPATPVLDGKLGSAATSLGNQVASFWADHTNSKPRFGPRTPVKPTLISADVDAFKIKLAPYLGGRVGALQLAPKRKQMVVIIHKVLPGVQIWLNLGNDHFLTLDAGDSLNDTFCRGPATGGSYELAANGELPIAITSTSEKSPAAIKVRILTSSDACPKPLVIQPGLAVGPLHLGMSLQAADQALTHRTALQGPVPTPFGAYTVADYREAKGSGAIAGFLDGRIAFLFVESPQFETTTGIDTLALLPPILGAQGFVPGSTLADFGAKSCAPIPGFKDKGHYCWKEGPKTRYTVAAASDADPCQPFPKDAPPPCTFPEDNYVFGLAVATSRGLKLIHFGANLFGAPPA